MPDFQKQRVQWFTGHMAKTRRQIKENLRLVDGVVEIVDARIPRSSSNPELDTIISRKPKLVLLNKSDKADENATAMWIRHYRGKGVTAIAVDFKTGKGLSKFSSACGVSDSSGSSPKSCVSISKRFGYIVPACFFQFSTICFACSRDPAKVFTSNKHSLFSIILQVTL